MLMARKRGEKTPSAACVPQAPAPPSRPRLAEPLEMRAPLRLGVAQRAAAEGRLERAPRPVPVRAAGERHARALALLAPEQVEDAPAQQRRVRARGRERRRAALAHPPRHRGAHVGDLPGEVLPGALEQPRPAQPADEPARAERRRHALVVGGHVAAREERGRGEHQQLQRALDVRRALRELPRREHVELALAGPADEVAPRGGRGHAPLEGEGGRGGVEHRRRAVHDHDEVAGRGGEALVEAVARVLELADDGGDVRRRRAPRGARGTCPMRSPSRPRATC